MESHPNSQLRSDFLDKNALLAKLLSGLPETGAKPPVLNGRLKLLIEGFLSGLSQLISQTLEREIDITLAESASLRRQDSLKLALRHLGQDLALYLPIELVQELSSAVLGREPSVVLLQPSETEISAISYLIASILSEEPLLASRRIYLQGSVCGSLQDLPLALPLNLKLSSSEYPIELGLSLELLERIRAHSKLKLYPGGVQEKIKDSAIFSAALSLYQPLGSLLALSQLYPGATIEFSAARLTLKL